LEGIIVCVSSNLYQVNINGKLYNCLARGKLKKQRIVPLPGDKVEIDITDEIKKEGTLEKVLPRITQVKRPKMANLTQMVFVVSMKTPTPDLLLLDKELAYANYLGIESIICFNKTDLEEDKEKIQNAMKMYENVGYKVLAISAKEGVNIDKLKLYLSNHITAFAGNSGVGKSTLMNSIFQKEITREGEISEKNKKGKNTTTGVILYPYEKEAYLADTPGFSTFEITEVPSEELDHYFVEFIEYLPKCEFNRL
jgi:ribosome biogenesis GTPase